MPSNHEPYTRSEPLHADELFDEPSEAQPDPASKPSPRRHAPAGPGRTVRTLFATGLSIVLMAALGASMTVAREPAQTLVWDSFDRPNAAVWGATDNGQRWLHPTGPAGFRVDAGKGVMTVSGRGRSLMTTTNTNVRDAVAQFGFSLDRMPGGSGVEVMAVLRKSQTGSYLARVRVAREGRVWLSVAKTRGNATKAIGQPVLVKGWRYTAGQTVLVRARVIKQDPTQLRIKAWPADQAAPATWQLVRNDTGSDIGEAGRVGLRVGVTRGATNPTAIVRFDDVSVTRSPGAAQVASRSKKQKSADKTKPEILRLGTTVVTGTSAKVEWALNEPANGFVKFGRTRSYGRESAHQLDYTHTAHAKWLMGLQPGTLYHYAVVSVDRAGNRKVSADRTFVTVATTTAPVPANAVDVPSSIDASGSQDVSAQLNTFIRNAPNGSTIEFKAGGTYRLGSVVRVLGKKRLTLDGNGATLRLSGSVDFNGSGIFVEGMSEDITIRDLTIIGNHAAVGTKDALGDNTQHQHAISVYGSTDTLIEQVEMRRVGGDCVYIDAHERRIWADGVTIRDSDCRLTGRMGVTIIAGSGVRVANNVFDDIGYSVIGIEPNASNEGATDIVVRDNAVGSYSLNDQYRGALFYACDAPWGGGATVSDVTITRNTVEGNLDGKDNRMRGIYVTICDNGPRSNFTVTNNTGNKAVIGPVLRFAGVNGVTVTGNVQPLSSGALATFSGSTNVTYDG